MIVNSGKESPQAINARQAEMVLLRLQNRCGLRLVLKHPGASESAVITLMEHL